jgi:hypothetical protein
MYCSENCRTSDWSSCHNGECNKLSHPLSLKRLQFDEVMGPVAESSAVPVTSMLVRMISRIGLDNIKKAAQENKPLKSFADPRTKGFQDGKFEAINLEALLSLEDNFSKLTYGEERSACYVSISSNVACVEIKKLLEYEHFITAQNTSEKPKRNFLISGSP